MALVDSKVYDQAHNAQRSMMSAAQSMPAVSCLVDPLATRMMFSICSKCSKDDMVVFSSLYPHASDVVEHARWWV